MTDQTRSLAEAVEQASDLLLVYGNSATCPRLVELAGRLRSGDNNAIVSAISEATGGAGSLSDQTLYPAAADDRLRKVIKKIEELARSIARERGIALVR